jgi:hypothetical protein
MGQTLGRLLVALAFGPFILSAAPPSAGAPPAFKWPARCTLGGSCVIQNYVDHDPGPGARDFNCGTLTYDKHNGVDIRLRTLRQQMAGVDVLAAADGKVLRVRDGVIDQSVRVRGVAEVKGEDCGNGVVVDHGGGWQTQYCHMAKASLSVKPGDAVRAGDRLGAIGLSGMTEYPHLHFTVRHDAEVVDPFVRTGTTPSCGANGDGGLWDPALRLKGAYRARAVLNAGLTTAPPTMDGIESGDVDAASPRGDANLLAYVRAIGLKTGDTPSLRLFDAKGATLAENQLPTLDRDKAQHLIYVGRKVPNGGWAPGVYRAVYQVEHDGKVVLSQAFNAAVGR